MADAVVIRERTSSGWGVRKANAVPSMGRPQPAIRDLTGAPMTISGPAGSAGRGWINSIAASTWYTPGQPVAPQAPPETPYRALDYPVGINIMYVPRSEEDLTYAQLRSLSDLWDLLRIAIESKKSQLCALDWTIRPVKGLGESAADYKARAQRDDVAGKAEQIRQIFDHPNGIDKFDAWLRPVLEDLIVMDTMAIVRDQRAGRTTFEYIDGGTIKRLLDVKGRTPEAQDGVAFQQIIKGVPAGNYTEAQLFYRRRNPRPHKIYGMSPVEQIAWTVNFAIRRAIYKMSYYTEGNIPEAFIQLPADWGLDQIRAFSEWFNSLLAGQPDVRRRAFFLPGVSGKDSVIPMKQDTLKDDMDEWLARVVRDALDLSPQPYVREMNRATAQAGQEASRNEGIAPWTKFLKGTFTDLIQNKDTGLGETDFEFSFANEEEFDQLKKAQRQALQVRNAIKAVNEARAENGDDPVEGGDQPGFATATGYVPVTNSQEKDDTLLEGMQGRNDAMQQNAQAGQAGKPSDGGDNPGGKNQPAGNVQKVTAADAFASRRQRRRAAQFQSVLERFLQEQARRTASRIAPAYDQRRVAKATTGELMSFVEEAGVELEK
ncbi:MAG TPA: hypothetical protein VKT20_01145 [Candidatus Dormibacteraeota bacterium]|nr:hypothetical protein [Candidatus Dormibacteraeota bacterium]